jgi:hypothetical protein
MRGEDIRNQTLFSYVRSDDRIPSNHPLSLIRQIADAALAALAHRFAGSPSTRARSNGEIR